MTKKIAKLDDFFSTSKVFKDNKVFTTDYVPDVFLYRETEIDKLGKSFARLFQGTQMHVWINGFPSTGKSHIVKKLTDDFNIYAETKQKKIRYIYCSCRNKTLPVVYAEIATALNPTIGSKAYNSGEAFHHILAQMKRFDGVCFIFDEIDKLRTTPAHTNPINHIFSQFTRLHENADGLPAYMIIAVSNDMKIERHLDTSTNATWIAENHHFNEYDAVQFSAILEERCKAGFHEKIIAIADIRQLGAWLCRGVKDIRTGLRILLTAGLLAEQKNKKNVDFAIIKQAYKEVEKNELIETISKLSDTQTSLLLSIAKAQQRKPDSLITSNDVYRVYANIVNQYSLEKLAPRYLFESVGSSLDSVGLITTAIKGRGRGKGVTKSYQIMGEDLNEIIDVVTKEVEKRAG